MPRMFDILRGKFGFPKKDSSKESVSRKKAKKDPDKSVNFPRQIHNNFIILKQPDSVSKEIENENKEQESTTQFSKKLVDAVKSKGVDNSEIAKEKYFNTLGTVELLLKKVEEKEGIDDCIESVYESVDTVTNQLILGNSLLENLTKDYSVEDYLLYHISNVCILSLAIGIQMNFNKSRLHTLGLAAMLYDVALLEVKDIISLPRKLSEEEFEKVKKHSVRGAEIISELGERYRELEDIVAQHHERIDGSGYPLGMKGPDINIYAKIIGLADTYEAMIHNRSYLGLKLPHQALKEILASLTTFFEPDIIKALVEKISIYPLGSFVKISNGETAKVISSNFTSPLRPIVLIVLDRYGRHLKEPKTLDLTKGNGIYVVEPVSSVKEKREVV